MPVINSKSSTDARRVLEIRTQLKMSRNWITAMPSRQRLRPIQEGSFLVYLQPQVYQYHTCTDNLHHSLLAGRESPNTRPLPGVPFHPLSFFRGMVSCPIASLAHWPGNVESSYVGTQSPGSSECLLVREELLRQGNESVRHPTVDC
jgi:hypothetical protein